MRQSATNWFGKLKYTTKGSLSVINILSTVTQKELHFASTIVGEMLKVAFED